MFHNFTFSYVLSLIKINKAKKSMSFSIKYASKTLFFVKLLYSINFLFKYEIRKYKNSFFINIYLNNWKLNVVGKNFKIFSKPSHSFYISLKAITLLAKKTGSSIFLVSTSNGILTHKEAIHQKTGGLLYGFLSI